MATGDQEHERYLATDRERHPSSGIDFRPEAAAYRGPSRHVIHRYACPDGYQGVWPDLETIEKAGKAIEKALKEVPSVIPSSVFYDRAVGAPYLEIELNRENMARYGVNVEDLQEILSAAVGGMVLTRTVEAGNVSRCAYATLVSFEIIRRR